MTQRNFKLTVQGRLADHLGKHLYKQRPAALAELISNSWDACATQCLLTIPVANYDRNISEIVLTDDGIGMSESDIQAKFLVLSRNRREDEDTAVATATIGGRRIVRNVMGRKGIGKLAGFGIAQTVEIVTWQEDRASRFILDGKSLRADPTRSDEIIIPGEVDIQKPDLPFPCGTQITLRKLKQKSPFDVDSLKQSLARRFSRKVIGDMEIAINGDALGDPPEWTNLTKRFPSEGFNELEVGEHKVKYWYGYHDGVIKPQDAQGVTILANGKIAQQTPFFFGAESGTGQFAGRYITGVFEADYLDAGLSDDDEESDIISTDRQEIDWEHERAAPLHKHDRTNHWA